MNIPITSTVLMFLVPQQFISRNHDNIKPTCYSFVDAVKLSSYCRELYENDALMISYVFSIFDF